MNFKRFAECLKFEQSTYNADGVKSFRFLNYKKMYSTFSPLFARLRNAKTRSWLQEFLLLLLFSSFRRTFRQPFIRAMQRFPRVDAHFSNSFIIKLCFLQKQRENEREIKNCLSTYVGFDDVILLILFLDWERRWKSNVSVTFRRMQITRHYNYTSASLPPLCAFERRYFILLKVILRNKRVKTKQKRFQAGLE